MRPSFPSITKKVNCKINIGLHILRKRPDGYHDIETIFYPTDYYTDTLTLSPCTSEFVFDCNLQDNLCATEDNLCVKALRLLQKHYPIEGVKIQLEKHIPAGAGLGGGSADAAFTLKTLAEIFQLPITNNQLVSYAAQLGSDVPFFLFNRPMYATGRGEIMQPVDIDLSDYQIIIRKPDFSVSTREAYLHVIPKENYSYLPDLIRQPIHTWKESVKNDFEASLFAQYPSLTALKEEFYAHEALYAAMSGSGTAVFGLFNK